MPTRFFLEADQIPAHGSRHATWIIRLRLLAGLSRV